MTEHQAAPALRLAHVRADEAGGDMAALLAAPDVLAVLGAALGQPALDAPAGDRDPRAFDLGLTPLVDVSAPWRQVLRSAGEVRCSVLDGLPVASDGDYLFTSLAIAGDVPLAQASRAAYVQLLQAVQRLGFGHLVRIWNYLPAINEGEGDAERYRQFCLGRFEAFGQVGRAPGYPAASALGLHAAPARIAVLAARHPATPVENPAQVSAFRYPREYGPASPSFSRASRLRTDAGELLFVSGTAAITGHVSLHPGDAAAQLLASLANIEIVVATAVGVQGLFSARPGVQASGALPAAQLRVYVRMPQDLPALRSAFAAQVQLPCSVEWLHADVCRRELLVEVEAAFCLPAGWPAGALPAVPGE